MEVVCLPLTGGPWFFLQSGLRRRAMSSARLVKSVATLDGEGW